MPQTLLTINNAHLMSRDGSVVEVILRRGIQGEKIHLVYLPNKSKKLIHPFGYWAIVGKRFNFIEGTGILSFENKGNKE